MGQAVGRYVCTVNQVGPASDGTETPAPVVYINLTETGGAFENSWFYAADGIQQQVLEVGTAAIAQGRDVAVAAVEPNATNTPFTQVSRIFGFALPVVPQPPSGASFDSLQSFFPAGPNQYNLFVLQVIWGGAYDSQVSFEISWQAIGVPLGGESQTVPAGSNFAHVTLDGGFTYELSVVAVNSVGKSPPSNSFTVTIPLGSPAPPQVPAGELSAAVAPLPRDASNTGLLIKGSNFAANETVAVVVAWTALATTGPHVLAPVTTDSSGSFEAWFTGDDPNQAGLCPVLVPPHEPQPAQHFFVCASGQTSKQTLSTTAGPFTCGFG